MSGVSILRTLCIVIHLKGMDSPNLNRQSFFVNLLTQNSAQMMYTSFSCPPILVAESGKSSNSAGMDRRAQSG